MDWSVWRIFTPFKRTSGAKPAALTGCCADTYDCKNGRPRKMGGRIPQKLAKFAQQAGASAGPSVPRGRTVRRIIGAPSLCGAAEWSGGRVPVEALNARETKHGKRHVRRAGVGRVRCE